MSNWHIQLKFRPQKVKKPGALYTSPDEISENKKKTKSEKSEEPQREPQTGDISSKKAWDLAKSPLRQLFMTGLMTYMSGNAVGIFPLIITGVTFYQAITAITGVNKKFEMMGNVEGGLFLQKLVFVLLQACLVGLGCYKLDKMGLLPSLTSKDISAVTSRQFEKVIGFS